MTALRVGLQPVGVQCIGQVFDVLAKLGFHALPASGTSSHELGVLREYFRGAGRLDPKRCYGPLFGVFLENYLLKNIAKNVHLVRRLNAWGVMDGCRRIVDIGGGPATFALSLFIWGELIRQGRSQASEVEIVVVDAVPEFLDVAERIGELLIARPAGPIRLSLRDHYITGDIGHLTQDADLIVFSNSMAEIVRNPDVDAYDLLRSLGEAKCPVAVIDHEYEGSEDLYLDVARAMNVGHVRLPGLHDDEFCACYGGISGVGDSQCEAGNDALCSNQLAVGRCIESIWLPRGVRRWRDLSAAHGVVKAYQKAWENHCLRSVGELFAPRAEYQEKQGEQPISGICEILRYWAFEASRQKYVRFEPLHVGTTGKQVDVAWWSRLFRTDLQSWLCLEGTLTAELDGTRICRFTERFHNRLEDWSTGRTSVRRSALATHGTDR